MLLFAKSIAGFSFWILGTQAAAAHVKWFSAYDAAGQPRGLENVLCQDFELLLGVALLWIFSGCVVERMSLGELITRSLNRLTASLRLHTEAMIRAICGFFFISLWAVGGILLTPELKTTSTLAGPLQLAIAAGLLSRRTAPLSAAGIVVLFGLAVRDYGMFHLADYPIFLGLAVYLALTGLQKNLFGVQPLDVVRYATAVTLMWASVEKWAYPEWSFPLLNEHPGITFGFTNEFYMRAAGMVEFTLAFALAWTPVVRRVAAAVLLGMFVSACFEFGKLDVIGHSAIIVVLVAILSDHRPNEPDSHAAWLAPVGLCAALTATLFAYYLGHAAIFYTTIL
ncbi:hypothetical protein EH240_14300 [Mesorhizobium tamadayense]|uniref:Uncharacterized protein n=1 Tax=Mesorhizobium tamadayense TaxID=425306 RepID=A0A3P3FSV4_9HYPH|nr:hypothetical protein [Mesorhizobium tamadayense]RRI01482.1 hypothetical protein EH240_14300 [Mesorhizobium tamadayense]